MGCLLRNVLPPLILYNAWEGGGGEGDCDLTNFLTRRACGWFISSLQSILHIRRTYIGAVMTEVGGHM